MHPAAAFGWDDAAALAFAADVAFAHIFALAPDGPRVAHAPLLVGEGKLRFHLSNANALTPHLGGQVATASLAAHDHYVSPNWYVAADQVPTWNYVAVELAGPVRRLDADELVALLDASAATFEPRVGQGWTRAKMAPARFDAMCGGITGFEMTIQTLRATRKLSQNKPDADVAGLVAALDALGKSDSADAIRLAQR
jgi:transcriptional regulator